MIKKYEAFAKPVSVNTLYGISNGRKYLSKEGRDYKNIIINSIGKVDYIFDACVEITLKFYLKNIEQDLDNLLKATIDSLTEANIWLDDDQVFQIIALKEFSDEYKVEIEVAGNCTKLINQKTILLIFEKVENITGYLKDMKNKGFKANIGRRELFKDGNKYVCVSKRQLGKIKDREMFDKEEEYDK